MTAFVLDPDHVQASEDGMTVPPLPGLWRNDVAIHPEALGITVSEMRDLVETLSLPLVEVKVAESRAVSEFPTPDYLSPTGPNALGGVAVVPAAETSGEEVDPEEVDVERARLAAEQAENAETTQGEDG